LKLRHKKIKISDQELNVGSLFKKSPIAVQREEILNAGKINHRIHGSFTVKQDSSSNLTIKCFILTDLQFAEFAEYYHVSHPSLFVDESKSVVSDPQNYLYSSKDALPQGNFDISIDKQNILYFILDNRFSKITAKLVQLTIWDEWDESILPLDVVTTTPPQDTSIEETTKEMILSAKKSLKILSPYFDMYLVKQLLEKKEQGIEIFIVTRDIKEVKNQKANVQALKYIQKELGENHKANAYIHSRMIIRDDIDALVSSADLTRDSLLSQYNVGLILSEPALLQKLINYFNQIFRDSEKLSM